MSATGQIGRYHWAQLWDEEPELAVPDVVRLLSRYVVGKVAVNISWDSGLLRPTPELIANGWSSYGEAAQSPLITEHLINAWPHSGCGFDEWYFFEDLPAASPIHPMCNHLGFRLADWRDYNQPWGADFEAQLEQTGPDLVLGESYSIYVLSPHPQVIQHFLDAAR